jgi:hypothetical protein
VDLAYQRLIVSIEPIDLMDNPPENLLRQAKDERDERDEGKRGEMRQIERKRQGTQQSDQRQRWSTRS